MRNPLPATGGVDPESVEEVRRFAPVAFRTQERAVTAEDYARMAERHEHVQRAAGSFRWTGSWRTVFVTVDPLVGDDDTVEEDLGAAVTRRSSAIGWPATTFAWTRRASCRSRSR